jgi:hypothetical protein
VEELDKNTFEITGVHEWHFVGLHHVTLKAHARHIKNTPFLFVPLMPTRLQQRSSVWSDSPHDSKTRGLRMKRRELDTCTPIISRMLPSGRWLSTQRTFFYSWATSRDTG